MEPKITAIDDRTGEAVEAKAYWSKPDTQALHYRQRSHYAVALAELALAGGCRSIFEFGCAAGRNLAVIRDYLRTHGEADAEVAGIDINPASVEAGRETYGLTITLGDERRLSDLPDASVDLAFTVSVLDHLPEPEPSLRHLLRISRGLVAFLEPAAAVAAEGIAGRIDGIANAWSGEEDEAAPFTYLHDYGALLESLGAAPALAMALPTHRNRSGPLYRLVVVDKRRDADRSDAAALRDRLSRVAVLQLLQNLAEGANEQQGLRREVQALRQGERKREQEEKKREQAEKKREQREKKLEGDLRQVERQLAKARQQAIDARRQGEMAVKRQLPHQTGMVLIDHLKRPYLLPMLPLSLYRAYRKVRAGKAARSAAAANPPAGRPAETTPPTPAGFDQLVLPAVKDPLLLEIRAAYDDAYQRQFGTTEGRGFFREADWRRIDHALGLVPDDAARVLDVGVGAGVLLSHLALSKRFDQAVGIDIQRHSKFVDLGGEADWRQMDVGDLAFADGQFDVVFCLEVLEHLGDQAFARALLELRRVTRRRLVMSVPFDEPRPLPSFHLQHFDAARIERDFPSASVTLLHKRDPKAGAAGCPWALIVEDR